MQWVLESQLASRGAKEERMNRVLLTGRLTRDPEMRVVTNGKNVTQLSIGYCRRTRSGHPRSGTSSTSVERSGEGTGGEMPEEMQQR